MLIATRKRILSGNFGDKNAEVAFELRRFDRQTVKAVCSNDTRNQPLEAISRVIGPRPNLSFNRSPLSVVNANRNRPRRGAIWLPDASGRANPYRLANAILETPAGVGI